MSGLRKNNSSMFLGVTLLFVVLSTPMSLYSTDTLVVMFYNVENFFDTRNDSLTNDDDFLPDGPYRWTYARYRHKASSIARVILSANGWNTPALVGVCEVENASVLNQLMHGSGLKNAGYDFIHFDSPDARGIDVALLYKRFLFKILHKQAISLSNSEMGLRTRDALYVKCVYAGEDTLHIVVNHWPSKRGGEKASEPGRIHAARQVRLLCDSILDSKSDAKLILMGDFNDAGSAVSLTETLGAMRPLAKDARLFNLSFLNRKLGSHKFQGDWSCIDHIIVSKSLCSKDNLPIFKVVDLPFLLEEDTAYSGVKPFRTYLGPRYLGGYSDHLPVIGFIPLE